MKFIKNEIDQNMFTLLKEGIEKDLHSVTGQIADLRDTNTGFMQYMNYGFSLFSGLINYYMGADLEGKRKLIAKLFPEKLLFVDGTYRTLAPDPLLEFICLNINNLQEQKEGTVTNLLQQSREVAHRAIEHIFSCKISSF